MKDYMVAHTFKSEEHRTKHFEASSQLTLEYMREHMKRTGVLPNESATQTKWSLIAGGSRKPAAILSMLGEMAELYRNDIKEMPMVANVAD